MPLVISSAFPLLHPAAQSIFLIFLYLSKSVSSNSCQSLRTQHVVVFWRTRSAQPCNSLFLFVTLVLCLERFQGATLRAPPRRRRQARCHLVREAPDSAAWPSPPVGSSSRPARNAGTASAAGG
uniref:Uncharacterized protein n=1 Tax=Arundo donax TaxID=35708 RepID=A0A0A9DCP7_ARUDO